MTKALWREHPVADSLGILAVNVVPGHAVVELLAIFDYVIKGSAEVDLDERTAVRFLSLKELFPAEAAGMLSVVELIERVPEDPPRAVATRVCCAERRDDFVALRVFVENVEEAEGCGVGHESDDSWPYVGEVTHGGRRAA